jgi:hypothetical protein
VRSAANFEEIVMLFNDTIVGSFFKFDLAALFFVNPTTSNYFTYNFLSGDKSRPSPSKETPSMMVNETLYTINKGETLLSKILDSIHNNAILNINLDSLIKETSLSNAFFHQY